jgi:hypothetical protein
MQQKLEEFISTADRSAELSRPPRENYSMHSELRRQEYAIKQILKALQPGLENFDLDSYFPESVAKSAAERGLGVLPAGRAGRRDHDQR